MMKKNILRKIERHITDNAIWTDRVLDALSHFAKISNDSPLWEAKVENLKEIIKEQPSMIYPNNLRELVDELLISEEVLELEKTIKSPEEYE